MTSATTAAPAEWSSLYPRTKLDSAIDTIAPALGCAPRVATAFFAKIQKIVDTARKNRYRLQVIQFDDYTAQELELFLKALPPHYTPRIDSVQDVIERTLLDPRRGEYALRHVCLRNGTCAIRVMRGNTISD